jgi:WD domain, G-beta repeat
VPVSDTYGLQIASFDGHTGNVTAVAWHCEGTWLVTGSEDGTLKIWDPRCPWMFFHCCATVQSDKTPFFQDCDSSAQFRSPRCCQRRRRPSQSGRTCFLRSSWRDQGLGPWSKQLYSRTSPRPPSHVSPCFKPCSERLGSGAGRGNSDAIRDRV